MEGCRWSDIHRLQTDNLFPINRIPAKVGSGAATPAMFIPTTPFIGPFGEATIPSSEFRVL